MRKNVKKTSALIVLLALFTALLPYAYAQNSPPVADANGPYSTDEGTEIIFDASASTDPDDDMLRYRWDFTEDGEWDTELSSDPTAAYTWFDDHTGTVTVFVTDDELNDTASADVTVYNVDPDPDAGEDIEINEGDEIPFDGSFFDPGMDTHTVVWEQGGNGENGNVCIGLVHPTLTLNGYERGSVILNTTLESNDFEVDDLHMLAHEGTIISVTMDGSSLPVDNPTDFSYDFATLMEQDSTREILIEMEPRNVTEGDVEKELWILQWHITLDAEELAWGLFSSEDAGDLYTFTKGIPDDCDLDFQIVYLYVTDDDGGYGFDARWITVNNVAPTVEAGDDQVVFEGEPVYFVGSFTDPGWLDTHEITWDFGNGRTEEGSLTPMTRYIGADIYTVTLTVVDDDGGSDSDTLTVEVHSMVDLVSQVEDLVSQLNDLGSELADLHDSVSDLSDVSDLADLVVQVKGLSGRITTVATGGLVVGVVVGAVVAYTYVKRKKD